MSSLSSSLFLLSPGFLLRHRASGGQCHTRTGCRLPAGAMAPVRERAYAGVLRR